jgi:UDP-N-acetyl-D-galactosamine dehydrogenase
LVPNLTSKKYDAVIVAVNHKQYLDYTEQDFINMMNENGVLVDIKGIYRGKIKLTEYWSL